MSFRIAFVTSELTPLAKTGGLADVSGALTRYLHGRGHDVRVFLPLYAKIDRSALDLIPVEFLQRVPIDLGGRTFSFSAYATKLPGSDFGLYLIHCPQLFDRPSLYTNDPDEHLRFLLLQRAALECCQGMGWSPQVVHCNDWQTGMIPLFLRTLYRWDRLFEHTRTVLTIHNIGYQGNFPAGIADELGIEERSFLHQDDLRHGMISFLKTGILYADYLTTVSPTYAREIQTKDFGMGLEDMLRHRADHLVGILNGVDYREWDPQTDSLLPHPYSADDLSGKLENKKELLRGLGLPEGNRVPVIGLVSRLTEQKGLEILREPLPHLLRRRDFRLVVLGSGEKEWEEYFHALQRNFPAKVVFHSGFNNRLAHLIEAGADMFLMPSRYEPCGLNQMYSLRYGTVPIVRKTGGLADTVQLYDPEAGDGNGFVFDHYNAEAVVWAMTAALDVYQDQEAWTKLMRSGMALDYSWDKQGAEYENLYAKLTGVPVS
ncbi:MAG: glycogen synthase GlgA [Candidatus Eisenbacteria bacterium]|uniref:Glycogen synthase n=1 Tax=Eiseniibacteriota bacterium TaxID=2212470 RepID=A0A956LYM3_UNCEI|nr:glycogen synthase GlgA [Candidatus Eisenbacteria bacterium]